MRCSRLRSTMDSMPVRTSSPRSLPGVADRLRRFERAASREDGETPEQPLLGFVEEIVAPIDRPAQRLLAGRQIPRAPGQQLQPLLQARAHGGRGKQLDARGGELDGEGQTVQARADLGDRRGVFLGQPRSPGLTAAARWRKARRPRNAPAPRRRRRAVRQRQRRHRELVLAVDVERRAARDQDLEVWPDRHELRHDRRRAKSGARSRRAGEASARAPSCCRCSWSVVERRGRPASSRTPRTWEIVGSDRVGIATVRERHEVDAAGEASPAVSRQPRAPGASCRSLRDPSGSASAHVARLSRISGGRPLPAPADEAGSLRGQARRRARPSSAGASRSRSRTAARSRARSRVDAYRSSGSLAMHRSTIQHRGAGTRALSEPIGSGSSRMMAARVSTAVSFLKGASARCHLVEHGTQRELVGSEVERPAARLLGRHVADRAQDHAGDGLRPSAVVELRRTFRSAARRAWRARSPGS